jgi:hypothetical protein
MREGGERGVRKEREIYICKGREIDRERNERERWKGEKRK